MTAKVKRGRPRDPTVDSAIVEAASELFATRGYKGMTVGAVAARAGVSEPTVYLRYPTKQDLAIAALAGLPLFTHPPDTGDALDDLELLLHQVLTMSAATGPTLIGMVLAEAPDNPELLDRWRSTAGHALGEAITRIVRQGKDRGQLRPDVQPGIVRDLLIGAYIARYGLEDQPDRAWGRRVVATLGRGLSEG